MNTTAKGIKYILMYDKIYMNTYLYNQNILI